MRDGGRGGGDCVIHTVSGASLGWQNSVNPGNRCLGIVDTDFRGNMSSNIVI